MIRAEGERGAREGGEEFRELSEETIMVLHSGRGSTKNFAKRIVFHMIDPEILMNSNCHGRTNKTSKRPNVQAIDPRVLSYAIRKTVELCGVKEDEIPACKTECFEAIDVACRNLFDNRK